MNISTIDRKGTSTTAIGLVVAVVIIVVGAGAYFALYSGGGSSSTTATTTATSTTHATTAISTSSGIASASVNAGGGTLVYPIMQDWINTYSYVQPNVQISYNAVGSGKGISGITSGLYNFGESDAPLTSAQYAALPSGSNLLTIPISDSGIIPAYNLPGITAHLNFTGNVLAEIFYGTITMWNDQRIAALQSPSVAAQLPAHAIQVYHRSDGSGTMYGFTQFLSDSNSTWAKNVGYSTGTIAWPVGVGCLHNAGVAACIASNSYSIGPLEIAYEIANPGQINFGAVQNHAGNFILANLTNISEALAAGVKNGLPSSDLQWSSYSVIQQTFNDSADKYIYPVSTFTYALVYQDLSASYASTTQAQAVAALSFLKWIITSGQAVGPNAPTTTLGYPPLPSAAVSLDEQVLATITYNGAPVLSGS
ncbi:MAG: phosphate ABC transporter substrate-binding protein PstS [Nitrososphaerota archaeon]|nr:phosphate ABC transporter substrate-binding protein PstS [Nitrososphaerota archaeon]